MGESKDDLIRQEIADEESREERDQERFLGKDGFFYFRDKDQIHDPDHLNPAKGGNKASDDYW